MSHKTRRPSPISASNIEIPASIRFLVSRVMKELVTSGTVVIRQPDTGEVDLEKLRIVIMKGMAIAHRIGVGVGHAEAMKISTRRHQL